MPGPEVKGHKAGLGSLRTNLKRAIMLWIGIYIKNFSMSADVGKGKSLVMLSNSRRMKHLNKALAVWKPS